MRESLFTLASSGVRRARNRHGALAGAAAFWTVVFDMDCKLRKPWALKRRWGAGGRTWLMIVRAQGFCISWISLRASMRTTDQTRKGYSWQARVSAALLGNPLSVERQSASLTLGYVAVPAADAYP